jgi:hypothetical protein
VSLLIEYVLQNGTAALPRVDAPELTPRGQPE